MAYSPVDTEVLALKFACDASQHYLYGAEVINIYTDCSALEGMFNKPLSENKNRRIRNMIEKLMVFNFNLNFIPGVENKIADCLSRLTRRIPATEHFSFAESTLGNYDKIKTISKSSPMECDDPWVQELAVMANNDADYMNMVSHIELGTKINNLP